MAATKGNCWLVADAGDPLARLLLQFAQLRGLRVRFSPAEGGILPALPSAPGNLIAIDAEVFESLAASQKERVRSFVDGGATLYLRGFKPGGRYTLQPFANRCFGVSSERSASGYRCAADPAVPSALHDEFMDGDLDLSRADDGLATPARALVLARYSGGKEGPAIFALGCGGGIAIYDLSPRMPIGEEPIVFRLSDPVKRCANIGALIAVDAAAGRDSERPAAFDLVIDDRPANFDYFSDSRLERLLGHLEARCPEVHIDFAWTPNQSYPSRRYISTLKAFNSGFVWHGFWRHIDHNRIDDLNKEVAAGRSALRDISGRFEVSFQPIMIFPFERSNYVVLSHLSREGFLASIEGADARPELESTLPGHLRYSTAAHWLGDGFVPLVRRYPSHALTRQRMLALATLGYPIIAAAHPGDVSLRRLAHLTRCGGSIRHFDGVLAFAAEKKLRPSSLEQITVESAAL